MREDVKLFIYEFQQVFPGSRVVLCAKCLSEMGHDDNAFDVIPLDQCRDDFDELERVCYMCNKKRFSTTV